jgi:hypothetical protein
VHLCVQKKYIVCTLQMMVKKEMRFRTYFVWGVFTLVRALFIVVRRCISSVKRLSGIRLPSSNAKLHNRNLLHCKMGA